VATQPAHGGRAPRTLHVAPEGHGAYPTIGDALRDVPDGGVIAVTAGSYTETFELVDRRLTLRSVEGAAVTLDGTGCDWPVLHVRGGSLTLQGIEVRAGPAAVQADDVELTVERCMVSARLGPAISVRGCRRFVISRCTISGAEQGIAVESSSGQIEGTSIDDVTGDGVVVGFGADPEIVNCTISGCGHRGVYVYRYARPVIDGCDISRTTQEGIAVTHQSRPAIRRTRIHDVQGVGIVFGAGCAGSLQGCHVHNTAEPGIALADDAKVTVIDPDGGR
jgi:parallel beta-helix repeat protein